MAAEFLTQMNRHNKSFIRISCTSKTCGNQVGLETRSRVFIVSGGSASASLAHMSHSQMGKRDLMASPSFHQGENLTL